MKCFSFGGGVQSMAVMVLSAQGKLDYTDFIFSNVGDDSENPDSIRYIAEIATPYAEMHDLKIHHVKRTKKDGTSITLYEDCIGDNKNIPIPVYLSGGGPAMRNCTSDWKVTVIEKWMRAHAGATKSDRKSLGVGISVDESHRMRTDDPEREPYLFKEYPLIDLRLTRNDCQRIIIDAGIPLAPKSSCWFCPFKKMSEWSQMRSDHPELYEKALHLEERINEKRSVSGKDAAFLSTAKKPLRGAVAYPTESMFTDPDEDMYHCESGYCMT